MIILHNSQDSGSREFVEKYGKGNTVVDWYQDNRGYENLKPSAFPSVVVDIPEYYKNMPTPKVDENGKLVLDSDSRPIYEDKEYIYPKHQELITKPKEWEEIEDEINKISRLKHVPIELSS